MLVLTRRPGESVTLSLSSDTDIEPIKVTELDNGKIGFEAEDAVQILRSELIENPLDS